MRVKDHRPLTMETATKVTSELCKELGLPPAKVEFHRGNQFKYGDYNIEFKRIRLFGRQGQTIQTLLHEVSHHYVYNDKKTTLERFFGVSPSFHGKVFRDKFEEVDKLFHQRDNLKVLAPVRRDVLVAGGSVLRFVMFLAIVAFVWVFWHPDKDHYH